LKNIKVGEIFGKGQAFENMGMLIGGFLGGLIAATNISYPWFMISLTYFVTVLFGFAFMKEKPIRKRIVKGIQKNLNEVLNIVRQSVHYTKTHKLIVYFLFAGAMVSFSFQIILQFWQPYFTGLKLPIETLGYIWVPMMLFLIYGSYFGTKLTKKFKNERPLILMSLVVSLLTYLGFALFFDFRIALFSLLLWEFGHGIHTPLVNSFYNEFIPRKQRATMLNFKSMIAKIGQVCSLLLTGYLADTYGLQLPFFLGTLLTFAGLIIYSGIKK
jgi:MFS family permease